MRTVMGHFRGKIGILLVISIVLLLCVTQLHRTTTLNFPLAVSDDSCANDLSCLPDAAVKGLRTVSDLHFKCMPSAQVTEDMTLTQARVNMFTSLTPTVQCNDVTRYGRLRYGGWDVCTAGPFYPLLNKCLVYSFGIEKDWSFDQYAVHEVKCEVHSFDPTIGLKDHRRPDGIMFHNLGLSGSNQVNEKGWPLKTLCSIMRQLGHEDETSKPHHSLFVKGNSPVTGGFPSQRMTIDVLKFDIEFSEWGAIEAMRREGCLKNVRQMAFEIHMWTDEDPAAYSLLRTNGFPRKVHRTAKDTIQDYTMMYQRLRTLQDAGFRAWKIACDNYTCFNPRDQPSVRYCPQCDMGYININFIR